MSARTQGTGAIRDGGAPARDTSVLRRLLALLQPHRRRLTLAAVLMLVTTGATLARPQLVQWGIDGGMRADSPGVLVWAISAYAVAALVQEGAGGWQRYTLIRTGVRVITDLRARLFGHLLRLPSGYHDRHRPGDLMSRVGSDAETLSDFITWSVIAGAQSLLTLTGIVVLLLSKDPLLAVVTLAVVPAMALATRRWLRATRERYGIVRAAVGEVSAQAEESLGGVSVVKGLGQERATSTRFGRASDTQRDADLGTDRLSAAFYPLIDVLSDLAVAIVLGVGGLRVLSGALEPGALVAFLLLVQQFFEPIRDLTTRLDSLQDASAAGTRIFEVLDEQPAIADRPDADVLPPVRGDVRLEDVHLAYGDGPQVLHGVALDVPAGSVVALVGETGAGKTSIARLVGRFYDVTGGRVLVDGHDVRDVTLESLRAQLAWVPQDVGLFAGTVADNLRVGAPDADLDRLRAAADAVGADEVLAALPDGYETVLEEGGGNLSAGERQLVAFVRALLDDPRILILDEASASVDVRTEARMQAGLRRLLAGRTALVIAHRLSTVVTADRIVVVDDGRIVEQGSHDELLAGGGRYARLYATQRLAEGATEDLRQAA